MFRLVGKESFTVGKLRAVITITPSGLGFEYALIIDGQSLKQFIAAQTKNTCVWLPELEDNSHHRVVLGEDR